MNIYLKIYENEIKYTNNILKYMEELLKHLEICEEKTTAKKPTTFHMNI